MAAPVAAYVQLPTDSANTGKKVRTQSRIIGADTVHEYFFIQAIQARVLGVYRASVGQSAVQAAAQNGTTQAFVWLHMPIAISGKSARIRRMRIDSMSSTALATPTAPRVVAQHFTFTGTASGATVAAVRVDQLAVAPVLDLRTQNTGLTVTLLSGLIGAAGITGALTAVGAYSPVGIDIIDVSNQEDSWQVIAPGEGVVVYQDVAGTTSDTRKVGISLLWDEIDTA